MSSSGERDVAGVILWPPLIYLIAFVIGVGLNWIAPLAAFPGWLRGLGLALIVLSFIPGPWAMLLMTQRRTSPEPWHPTTALVTDGPFRLTRNPIYLTFTLFMVGVALLISNVWLLILTVPVVWVMNRGVIAREERYLTRLFGEAYTAYCARVRRWV